MKIIISPAKNLKTEFENKFTESTQPTFLDDSEYLIKKLRKLSKKKIGDLMKISPALSELNYNRYESWNLPFTDKNALPALYIFAGEVYRGMDVATFTKKDLKVANESLRILSGLYGLLKPSDLIQPYRLEMGTRLEITSKTKGLYKFWGNKLTDKLNEAFKKDDVLVNLASKEYFKAVDFSLINAKVITCTFKDNKNGVYKSLMAYGKLARGFMTRFIIKNNLKKVEHLKTFAEEGYIFNPKFSNEDEFVFTRG